MLPCELPEATASVATGIATGRLMIHHQNLNQPQSFGDFGHGCFSRLYTKLTCLPFSYHYHHRSKGTTSLPRCWRRGATTRETSLQLANSLNRKKHKLCLLSIHPHIVAAYYGMTKPTVCFYRRQWNPCHMDFGLVFQQAIDRQDRTS